MPWVLYLQEFSCFVYEFLDFIEVYGTACRIVVKLIYRRLHQRYQFIRNPHGFVAGRSVGLFTRLLCGCYNGSKVYVAENSIPEGIVDMTVDSYDDFLAERRVLMAKFIENYYKKL